MKVEVTDWCIKNGIPYNCCACPIALALKRAGVNSVLVWSEYHMKRPMLHASPKRVSFTTKGSMASLNEVKTSFRFAQGNGSLKRGKTKDEGMREDIYMEIHLRFQYNGVWFHVKAPKQVEQFILKFDHKPSEMAKLIPFEFELDLS